MVSVSSTAMMSVRWVMVSPAVVSLKSRMLVIMSRSVSSMTPFSSPSPTIWRISSSVTRSSKMWGSMRHSRRMPLAMVAHSFKKGKAKVCRAHSGPAIRVAKPRALLRAPFFGSKSPNRKNTSR